MRLAVKTKSGVRISIRHRTIAKDKALILAPGFFQSKETKTFKEIEKDLLPFFDVISMDFRGHGFSSGWYTFSAREKEDLHAVVDYARRRYKRVGVLGFSFGGTIAILAQAELNNIDSLACVGSPMAYKEIRYQWWWPHVIGKNIMEYEIGKGVRLGNPFLKKVNAIDVIDFAVPIPVLFIHGGEDRTVHERHSRALHKKANGPKEIIFFEKGAHAEQIYKKYPNEFIAAVKDWFLKTL